MWLRRFPAVPNRSLTGCETTSTRSPAKSRASSSRASSRLSAPWWRPVLTRNWSPGRCRCPRCQEKQRIGSASVIGVWMSSRTEQDTWSPLVFQVAVHRPGQPSPKSRPALPVSAETGTRSSSQAARCDHSGSAVAAPAARVALRGLSPDSMCSGKASADAVELDVRTCCAPFGMMHGIAQTARVRVARQPDASAAAATVSRTASRISCSGQYWLAGW